jgi:hypothetical protein
MTRALCLIAVGLGVSGCIKDISREDIFIEVEADTPFVHEEEYLERREGHYLEEIDVPSRVDIGYSEEGLEILVFSGTVAAGEYDFELRFQHYGDMPRMVYTHWSVSLVAE